MCARMRNHSTASRPPAASAALAALIDIGINLAHDSYDADRDAVLARAQAAGVVQMVITGSTLASTQRALALARAHPARLFATAGVHPHHASELSAPRAPELEDLARQPEVVAIGECGLDYFRDFSPRAAQRQAPGRAHAANSSRAAAARNRRTLSAAARSQPQTRLAPQ